MTTTEDRRIFRRYYFSCTLLCIILALFGVGAFLLWQNIWVSLLITCLLIVFVFLPIVRLFAHKHIFSVLHHDLDPKKFQELFAKNTHFVVPPIYQISAAFTSGDYQTAVNMCVKKIEEVRSVKQKCIFLSVLAGIYFELGDAEKIVRICNRFDAYVQTAKRPDAMQKQFPFMPYYQAFATGEELRSVFPEQKPTKTTALRQPANKLAAVYATFYIAVALYKANDLEKAKKLFCEIIESAPKIHLSVIAANYLTAIETNDESILTGPQILPDPTYRYANEAAARIRKRCKIYGILWLIAFFLYLAASSLSEDPFEKTLHNALDPYYEEYEVVECFSCTDDSGTLLDTLCVVQKPDESVDIGHLVRLVGEDATTFVPGLTNVIENKRYMMESTTAHRYVFVILCNSQEDAPTEIDRAVKVQVKGDTKWLCFDF